MKMGDPAYPKKTLYYLQLVDLHPIIFPIGCKSGEISGEVSGVFQEGDLSLRTRVVFSILNYARGNRTGRRFFGVSRG